MHESARPDVANSMNEFRIIRGPMIRGHKPRNRDRGRRYPDLFRPGVRWPSGKRARFQHLPLPRRASHSPFVKCPDRRLRKPNKQRIHTFELHQEKDGPQSDAVSSQIRSWDTPVINLMSLYRKTDPRDQGAVEDHGAIHFVEP